MTFNDWLQSLPVQDNIDVAENPRVLRLLREAYAAGKVHADTLSREQRQTSHVLEAMRKAAVR